MRTIPHEIISIILEEATRLNLHDAPQWAYGLGQIAESSQLQRHVRGQLTPDALEWNACSAIRQVNRQWHDWACNHALRNLYISRWRGSERWNESRILDTLQGRPSSIAVYRDPYHSLKSTDQLLSHSPGLAGFIRRVWFNSLYGIETVKHIFGILRKCDALEFLTLPWTALRYGTAKDWVQLLSQHLDGRHLSSLEFLAVDLKETQSKDAANQTDNHPLQDPGVDFSKLERLKIFGSSNFKALSDSDLIALARTAKNLRELHVTGTTTSITIDGIMALTEACQEKLQILEYSPLSEDGFGHPNPASPHHKDLCQQIIQCRRLRNLSISMPSLCIDLFVDTSIQWDGEVQIRVGNLCGKQNDLSDSPQALECFWHILEQARSLMATRRLEGADLNIELFIDHLIFEPREFRVHGNFDLGVVLSNGSWPAENMPSSKGPYGQTGLYGKDDGPFSCVSEECLAEGLLRGFLSF